MLFFGLSDNVKIYAKLCKCQRSSQGSSPDSCICVGTRNCNLG